MKTLRKPVPGRMRPQLDELACGDEDRQRQGRSTYADRRRLPEVQDVPVVCREPRQSQGDGERARFASDLHAILTYTLIESGTRFRDVRLVVGYNELG